MFQFVVEELRIIILSSSTTKASYLYPLKNNMVVNSFKDQCLSSKHNASNIISWISRATYTWKTEN